MPYGVLRNTPGPILYGSLSFVFVFFLCFFFLLFFSVLFFSSLVFFLTPLSFRSGRPISELARCGGSGMLEAIGKGQGPREGVEYNVEQT